MRLTRAQAAAQAAQIHTDESAPTSDSETQDVACRTPLSEIVANAADPETAAPERRVKRSKAKAKGKSKESSRAPSAQREHKEEQHPDQRQGQGHDQGHGQEDDTVASGAGRTAELAATEQLDNQAGASIHIPVQQKSSAPEPESAEDEQTPEEDQETPNHEEQSQEQQQPPEAEIVEVEQPSNSTAAQLETQEEENHETTLEIHHEETRTDLSGTQVALDPESPSIEPEEIIIVPQRTPAKNLLAKQHSNLRSTSNKENETPFAIAATPEQNVVRPENLPVVASSAKNGEIGSEHIDQPMPIGTAIEPAVAAQDAPSPLRMKQPVGAKPKSKPTEGKVSAKSTTKPSARQSTRPSTGASARPSTLEACVPTRDDKVEAAHKPVVKPEPSVKRAPSIKRPLTRPSTAGNLAPSKDRSISRPSTSKGEAVVQIPHSRPRPVSISFPTPPLPPKSSRPPTKSTFQLPGEAVAARLKAAKEERQKREAEEALLPKKKKVTEPPKPALKRESVPVQIPHSRPRPVSMSFPTPPPPPKSTKVPTKSTFQLPGEAIAAKLKAAREERLKREQEDLENRRSFKARPAPRPKDSGPATVRQTASSRARESLMLGKPVPDLSSSSSGTIRRATSVRESMITGRSPAVPKRPSTISSHPKTVTEEAGAPSTAVPVQTSAKDASTVKPRSSSATTAMTTTVAKQRPASSGTKKGREVFQRAVAEKEALDKQKREKEDAVKKAKADAAERGRIASREWAEKMKLKSLTKAKQVQSTSATAMTATTGAV